MLAGSMGASVPPVAPQSLVGAVAATPSLGSLPGQHPPALKHVVSALGVVRTLSAPHGLHAPGLNTPQRGSFLATSRELSFNVDEALHSGHHLDHPEVPSAHDVSPSPGTSSEAAHLANSHDAAAASLPRGLIRTVSDTPSTTVAASSAVVTGSISGPGSSSPAAQLRSQPIPSLGAGAVHALPSSSAPAPFPAASDDHAIQVFVKFMETLHARFGSKVSCSHVSAAVTAGQWFSYDRSLACRIHPQFGSFAQRRPATVTATTTRTQCCTPFACIPRRPPVPAW